MTDALPRSPLLMSAAESAVLVVDMQPKLLNLITNHELITWNIGRLLDAAKIFGMPSMATEQYPQGLGPTHDQLKARLSEIPNKLSFSCGECAHLFTALRSNSTRKLLVCGIETHVCVMQTVMDLLHDGFEIYVAVDAVGARFEVDHRTAIGRMELAGANLTTTESAMFEWCEQAGTPEFKQISALVRAERPI